MSALRCPFLTASHTVFLLSPPPAITMVFCLSKHPSHPRLLGHNRYFECPDFYFLSFGVLFDIYAKQTRATASLSFPQAGKSYCRGFQWGVVLLHSEIYGSVFIVEIIGGHSWNWGSVCEGKCQVPAIHSAKYRKVVYNKWSQDPHAFQYPIIATKPYNYLSLN